MRRVRPESDRTLTTVAKVIAGAAVGLAVSVLLWRGWRLDDAAPPSAASTVVRASPARASAMPARLESAAPPRPASAVARLADDPRCVIREPAAPAQADASADASSPSPAPVVDPRAQASRARLLARMSGSPDPYANAVAIWLDVDVDSDEAQLAERQRRLAAMAASTQDPRLYSLALRTCWRRQQRPCDSGLSARRWSELEPANALPWLMMLDEAAQRGDLSGMQEAMFHVTQAQRYAERSDAPLQPIIDAADNDADSLLAARALAEHAIGLSAAQAGPAGYTVCRHATSANANVWQQCLAVADLLAQRSDTLLQRAFGQRLHQQLTGEPRSAAQIAALERMYRADIDLFTTSGCDDLRAKLAVLRRMAVEGQVAVAQDLAH